MTPISLLDAVHKLRALCHHPNCQDLEGCPRTHNPCGKRLDMQTAIAWMLSFQLEKFVFGGLTQDEIHLLVDFCFHALGQHQEEKWFRNDIFDLINWVDIKVRWNLPKD